MQVSRKPQFSEVEAIELTRSLYAVSAEFASELPSERDQNFKVGDSSGRSFVLKVSNPEEDHDVLDFQNRVLKHLARESSQRIYPTVVYSRDGQAQSRIEKADEEFWIRLVRYVDGVPLWQATDVGTDLHFEFGEALGEMDLCLSSFSHPSMDRYLYWDSRHAVKTIRQNLAFIEDPRLAALIEGVTTSFSELLSQNQHLLRRTVIHNDANDHNVLVERASRPESITGIIDFGDIVRTFTVCELANACAYVMMGESPPFANARALIRGYNGIFPLSPIERDCLFDFVIIRLCLSVSNAARQQRQAPENEYLSVSEQPARELLQRLVEAVAKGIKV